MITVSEFADIGNLGQISAEGLAAAKVIDRNRNPVKGVKILAIDPTTEDVVGEGTTIDDGTATVMVSKTLALATLTPVGAPAGMGFVPRAITNVTVRAVGGGPLPAPVVFHMVSEEAAKKQTIPPSDLEALVAVGAAVLLVLASTLV